MRNGMRTLVRLAAISIVAGSLGACSTMNSMNPWGGSSTASDTDDNGYPVAGPPSDDTATADATTTEVDNSASADSASYPNVASVPDKPKPSATPEQRKEIASTLVSDRDRAQYSADALRGGTEPAAAPPPPAAPHQDLGSIEPSAPATVADNSDNPSPPVEAAAPAPQPAEPVAAPTHETQVASLAPTTPSPAARASAATGPIPGAEPAIPSDEPLAFKPSSAPPLDSSVSQFVPEEVLSRYQATQAQASTVTAPSTATTKVKVSPADPVPGPQSSNAGSSVFVNLDAANNSNNAGVVKASAGDSGAVSPAAWRAPGSTPTGVVFFAANNAVINPAGQTQIRSVAEAFKQHAGNGYVRVVGHAASRTTNMALQDHIAFVFKQSQQNADAVAQALIKAGVPAKAVIIEAVGDTQPVYYESMPQGEDGNRRTEIFIEG